MRGCEEVLSRQLHQPGVEHVVDVLSLQPHHQPGVEHVAEVVGEVVM